MRRRTSRGALACLLAAGVAILGASGLGSAGAQAPAKNPFYGDGMWIWYVSKAGHGDVRRIARRAHRRGIETLFIKSGDAGSTWSQFSPRLVDALQDRGLNVCGWQFVYGAHPKAEAKVGAATVNRWAD